MKLPYLPKILPTLLLLIAMIFAQAALPAAAAACNSTNPNSSQSAQDVLSGVGGSGNCSDSGVTSTVSTAVNILSLAVGIAAVIMIIVSGFKYITSGGSSEKVGSAKNALIYALVGVAIAALAQVLVHFVLTQSGG